MDSETLQHVEKYSAMPFSVGDVARLCELEPGTIENDKEAMEAYRRGQLRARSVIYAALMGEVRERGSVQAAREMARQFESVANAEDEGSSGLDI